MGWGGGGAGQFGEQTEYGTWQNVRVDLSRVEGGEEMEDTQITIESMLTG